MRRSPTPFTRALALFLCCQPVLWMSHVALAQTVEQQAIQAQQGDPRFFQSQQGNQQQMQMQQMQQGGAQQGGILQGTGAAPQQGGVFNQFPPANVPGEQEGMRPERSLQPLSATQPSAVDEPIDPEKYILGPNDVLELHFWGVENFRVRVTVDLEGRGFVPQVGYLVLQGKTLAEGQRMLKDVGGPLLPEARLRRHPGRAPHLPRAGGGRRGPPRVLPGQGHRARGHAHRPGRWLRPERLAPPHRGEATRRDRAHGRPAPLRHHRRREAQPLRPRRRRDPGALPVARGHHRRRGEPARPLRAGGHLRPGRAGGAGGRAHPRRHHRAAGAGGASVARGEAHAPRLRLRRRGEAPRRSPWSARTASGSRPSPSCSSR